MAEIVATPVTTGVIGQVKWFNSKTGYGFITVMGESEFSGKDIFAHYSNLCITHSQYKYLVQGEYVMFDMVKPVNSDHEYHAININGVYGGKIMCEVRHLAMKERESRRPEIEGSESEWNVSETKTKRNGPRRRATTRR